MNFAKCYILFVLIAVKPCFAQVITASSLEAFAYSPEWLNLLYYEKKGAGYKSLVTSKAYFASDFGAQDPLAELKSSLSLLSGAEDKTAMHPQCAFPARYEILRKHFPLPPPVACLQLDVWLSSYEPTGIELVYTSQFIANPASVFGHAFLLVPSAKQVEALWHSFNFAAAIPSDVNPFAYVWGGLTGWYAGDFSILPYYQRLFQYNAIENRDLWRYPIKLSSQERILVIKHFWEVIHLTRFSYYFLNQNCASYILRSLAAVLPDFTGTADRLLYVHPVDVIKILKAHHRLEQPTRVPSSFEILKTRYDELSSDERKSFWSVIQGNQDVTRETALPVLEAAVDYLSLERTKNEGELPERFKGLEKRIFIARAKFPPRFVTPVTTQSPPDSSHESMRASLGFSNQDHTRQLNLGYRVAIHDLLEDGLGFLPRSSVEALSGHVSVFEDQDSEHKRIKVRLHDLTFLKVENYPTLYRIQPSGSWLIHLFVRHSPFELESNHRYQGAVHTGYGATATMGDLALFAMAMGESFTSGPESSLYVGGEGGLLWDVALAHVIVKGSLASDPIQRGKNPKWNGHAGVGVPFTHSNSLQMMAERECLYKKNLCRFEYGAEWRQYF